MFQVAGAVTGDIYRPNGYVLKLFGPFVESSDRALIVRIDNIGIAWVRSDEAALTAACRIPIAAADNSFIAGAGDSDVRIVLLCSVDTIRESVVRRDMIKLGRRLIIEGGPGLAPVCGNRSSPVICINQPLRIIGFDPQAMMIAMRCG